MPMAIELIGQLNRYDIGYETRKRWMVVLDPSKYHLLGIRNPFDSKDDFRSGCRGASHCHQQQFSGPGCSKQG